MRLHHRDHLALGRLARGLEHGGDLDRMVAVIVDDRGAVPFAGAGEAPLDAAETRQRLADRSSGTPSSRATAIAAVALSALWWPGIGRREILDRVCVSRRRGRGTRRRNANAAVGMIEIDEPHIGLRIHAVGDDAAVLDAADQRPALPDDRCTSPRSRRTAHSRRSAGRRRCTASKVPK